jgi:hypothetical protein
MLRRLLFAMSATGLLTMGLFAQATSASANPTFNCTNNDGVQVQVVCIGNISNFPITVTVKDVRVLNDNEINVLSNDLNNIAVKDNNILDGNKILNDVDVTVLNDFLNKFKINVSNNDVQVCTSIASVQVCKS